MLEGTKKPKVIATVLKEDISRRERRTGEGNEIFNGKNDPVRRIRGKEIQEGKFRYQKWYFRSEIGKTEKAGNERNSYFKGFDSDDNEGGNEQTGTSRERNR
jgi:hypothetical protein